MLNLSTYELQQLGLLVYVHLVHLYAIYLEHSFTDENPAEEVCWAEDVGNITVFKMDIFLLQSINSCFHWTTCSDLEQLRW